MLKWRFHIKLLQNISPKLLEECNSSLSPFKVQQIRGILYGRERICLKPLLRIASVVYLYAILFRMHERDTTTEEKRDTALQMTVEHIQIQIFKQVLNGQQK